MESDKSNLQQVWPNDFGVLTLEPHGYNLREELGPYPGGGHQGRGEGDLFGVLPPRPAFGGLYVVRVQDTEELHVQDL